MLKQMLLRIASLVLICLANSCQETQNSKTTKIEIVESAYKVGSFGYDLEFLQKYDSVLVLSNESGLGKIIVSPKYQGKVFTSAAEGLEGKSFGWVNYKAFDAAIDPHMNAYGGEDRLWLGPEGGPFSLFFEKDKEMIFANWKTPTAIDTEPWTLISADSKNVRMEKRTKISNYAGTVLDIQLDRKVQILNNADIENDLGIQLSDVVKSVAFSTVNTITNTGIHEWTPTSGAPCLWILDMFMPADSTVILIPYEEAAEGKIATTDYFGEIAKDRITTKDGMLYFKADGKSRGKLGLSPSRAKNIAGSYDLASGVLTVTQFTLDPSRTYLNQEWTTKKDPLIGDAVNAYNDGPLDDGGQMGPFYEIESVSPAAFLKPAEKLVHRHNVYHFAGNRTAVAKLLTQLFNIREDDIKTAFKSL